MPIYGYRCQECHQEFEVTQRMSDPAVATCPACGGAGTRLFFPAGIVFKGSGFYKTDSRSVAKAASSPVESTKAETPSTNGASSAAKDGTTPSSTPAATAPSTSPAPSTPKTSSTPSTASD